MKLTSNNITIALSAVLFVMIVFYVTPSSHNRSTSLKASATAAPAQQKAVSVPAVSDNTEGKATSPTDGAATSPGDATKGTIKALNQRIAALLKENSELKRVAAARAASTDCQQTSGKSNEEDQARSSAQSVCKGVQENLSRCRVRLNQCTLKSQVPTSPPTEGTESSSGDEPTIPPRNPRRPRERPTPEPQQNEEGNNGQASNSEETPRPAPTRRVRVRPTPQPPQSEENNSENDTPTPQPTRRRFIRGRQTPVPTPQPEEHSGEASHEETPAPPPTKRVRPSIVTDGDNNPANAEPRAPKRFTRRPVPTRVPRNVPVTEPEGGHESPAGDNNETPPTPVPKKARRTLAPEPEEEQQQN